MPMIHNIDKINGIIVVRCIGRVTNEDLVSLPERIIEDPDLVPGMPGLTDYTETTDYAITAEGVELYIQALARTRSKRGPAKSAIIVADDVQYGMSRMSAAIAENKSHLEFKTFRDRASALTWLLET